MESPLREGGRDDSLRLIETVLWNGKAARRWPLHLARLTRSAAALGWDAPAPPLLPAPAGPARLRLTLDRHGVQDWQIHPLPPVKAQWRAALHPARLDPGDPWLGVKTTRRQTYDAARAALPEGLDEWIFANTRGEVCEGTITSLFFDRGAGLRTPPLTCGLLPGVLRAELACPEEVLRIEDLPHVDLWCGNALRGLIPLRLVPQEGAG